MEAIMHKIKSGDQTNHSHDSFSDEKENTTSTLKGKTLPDELREELTNLITTYKKDPNPQTYHGYRVAIAKYKAHVEESEYKEPKKVHDFSMADLFLKFSQANNLDFFVGVLGRFKRKGLWSIPTMEVGTSSGTYYFGYHPEWYKYYSLNFCLMVLQHEAHHLLQNHIPRYLRILNSMRPADEMNVTKSEGEALRNLMSFSNIASDEDVNSILLSSYKFSGEDTSNLVCPEDYGHPERLAYEQYLNKWLLNPYSIFTKGKGEGDSTMEQELGCDNEGKGRGHGQPGEGGTPGSGQPSEEADREFKEVTGSDGHPWVKDLDKALPPDEETLKKIQEMQEEGRKKGVPINPGPIQLPSQEDLNNLADILEKQSERALIDTARDLEKRHGRGVIPGNYLEKYDQLSAVCELHWTDILSTMISDPKQQKETYRIHKHNRNNILMGNINKYGFKEDDPKYRIWVSLDTSGSMRREDVEEGLAVILSLLKSDSEIEVTVCEFDTTINRIRHLTVDDEDYTKDVIGRGGTDFNCVFTHLQEEVPEETYPDMHIIFTDGGAPPPERQNRIPTHKLPLLWVLTSTNPTDWFRRGDGAEEYGSVIQTR